MERPDRLRPARHDDLDALALFAEHGEIRPVSARSTRSDWATCRWAAAEHTGGESQRLKLVRYS